MSRRRYVVEMDGHGLTKPTAVRSKAIRSRGWWARRCPGLVEVSRINGRTS